jgi:hypothetical protein
MAGALCTFQRGQDSEPNLPNWLSGASQSPRGPVFYWWQDAQLCGTVAQPRRTDRLCGWAGKSWEPSGASSQASEDLLIGPQVDL